MPLIFVVRVEYTYMAYKIGLESAVYIVCQLLTTYNQEHRQHQIYTHMCREMNRLKFDFAKHEIFKYAYLQIACIVFVFPTFQSGVVRI